MTQSNNRLSERDLRGVPMIDTVADTKGKNVWTKEYTV